MAGTATIPGIDQIVDLTATITEAATATDSEEEVYVFYVISKKDATGYVDQASLDKIIIPNTGNDAEKWPDDLATDSQKNFIAGSATGLGTDAEAIYCLAKEKLQDLEGGGLKAAGLDFSENSDDAGYYKKASGAEFNDETLYCTLCIKKVKDAATQPGVLKSKNISSIQGGTTGSMPAPAS